MKKVVIIILILGVLLTGLLFSGHVWLKARFEKESLVAQMEAAWNCRVSLDSTSLKLTSSPAQVELHGLKFAPRDEEVKKALADRAPLDPQTALVSVDRAVLVMTLSDLVRRTANVEKLHLEGLNLRTEIDKEGRNSVDALFKSPPDSAITKVEPQLAANVPPTPPPVVNQAVAATPAEEPKKEKKPKEQLKATDLLLALQIEDASVTKARVEVLDLKNKTRTTLENVSFTLKGIDVNPQDLANHNQCGFEFIASIHVEKPKNNEQLANFTVEGKGSLKPFDVSTGEWKPDLNLAVIVKKGGLLGGTPLSEQLNKKDLEKLKKYSIDLGDLAIGGVLQEDAQTEVHSVGSEITVKKDTHLAFPQYEIVMMESSWFNSQEDEHNTRGKLIASPELTARMLSNTQTALKEQLGESLAALAIATVNSTLMDEQKRLVLPFKSKGRLSKPDVRLDNVLGDVTDAFKEAGKSFLESLLKQ